jgi:long-chain fatty acid transport protein
MRHFNWRYASVFAAIGFVAVGAGETQAAGFQLRETNSKKLGYAHAGSGTEVGDVAAQWDNPATLTTLDKNALGGSLVGVFPQVKYDIKNSTGLTGAAMTGNDGDNGGTSAALPAAYVAWHVNQTLRLGLGITAPWGLKTDYNKDWLGTLFATRSSVETVNVNPAVAFKINDMLSIGGGFSVEYIKAVLGEGFEKINAGSATSEARVQGNDVGYGFNAGVLFQPWKHTRFALAYRSQIKHSLSGDFRVADRANNRLGALLAPDATKVRADVTLPETVTFSAHHDLNAKWNVRADIQFTRWARLNEIDINYDWNPSAALLAAGAVTQSKEIYKNRNTWFFALGTGYQWTENTLLKFGVAYDMGMTRNNYRSPRIPDANRIWLSAGLEQKLTDSITASLDYTFIHVKRAEINLNGQRNQGKATLVGRNFSATSKAYVNLIGAKVQWKF